MRGWFAGRSEVGVCREMALVAGLLVGLSLAVRPGAAAPADSGLLAGAVEAAWRRSVDAASARGRDVLAAAQADASRSWWAAPPALEASRRVPRGNDAGARTESEVALSWPVLMPGQRVARMGAADIDGRLARASHIAARWKVAGEVREAAWAVVAREGERSLAKRDAEVLRELALDVDRRVAAGELARADALAARAESLAADTIAAEASQRLDAALANWASLTGGAALPREVEPVLEPASVHPEVERARLAAERARHQGELVRLSRSEPPELTVRYRRETAPGNPLADNSVGLGVRIPLGTDDRNRPREAEALAALASALAEQAQVERHIAREIEISRQAVALTERALAVDIDRAALLSERASLVEKSFRAGQGSLPELLRASLASRQAQAASEARHAALGLARARLNQAYGHTP